MWVKRAGMTLVGVLAMVALVAGQVDAGGRRGGGGGGGGRGGGAGGGRGGGVGGGRGGGVGGGRGQGRGGGLGGQRGGGQQGGQRGGGGGQRGGQAGSGARGFSEVRGGSGSAPGRPAGSVDSPPTGPERWQYQRSDETTLTGVVMEEPAQGKGRGLDNVILVQLANGETRRVVLGPPWYRDELGLDLKPGDTIEIVGAPHASEKGAILARELTWNGSVFQFRTDEGIPIWAGADRADFGRYASNWNGGKAEEIAGEVGGVEGVTPGQRDMGTGVVVRLKVPEQDKERHVHLGPFWYVEESLPGLRVGQQLSVKGSPAEWKGEQVVVASEVERNKQCALIRTEQGRPAWAGGWRNWDGWGPGSQYGKLYDPSKVRTVDGWVEKVETGTPMSNMGQGLMATVRTTQQERLRVHIGPSWFVEQANLSLKPGDSVKLEGSLVAMNGKSVLIVSDFSSGARHIQIRQKDGTPVWAGRTAKPEAK